jgi:hypothetical protein
MSATKSKSSWAWMLVQTTGSTTKCCVRLGADGVPQHPGPQATDGRVCGKVIKTPTSSNIRHHLRTHGIADENAPYVRDAAPTAAAQFGGDVRAQRRASQQLDSMCVYAQGLARCQEELFTDVVDTLPRSRENLRRNACRVASPVAWGACRAWPSTPGRSITGNRQNEHPW